MPKTYSLPLKHVEWTQKELEILERAGVIQRSMSPWASPIVIVPKKSEPGEPPRRRMCVDYRMLNSLLPPVNKAHSKAKGIVTLVPLPKIDEIYAQLQGSKIFSALCCDMDQSDTIGKIELIPSIVLSSDNTDCKNDIQLFPQLFDELSVHTDYH